MMNFYDEVYHNHRLFNTNTGERQTCGKVGSIWEIWRRGRNACEQLYLLMQHGQHFGAHVIGFHGGLIQRCSSGGDVALYCCHIDASELTITQLEVNCTFAPCYSRVTRNHQSEKRKRRKIAYRRERPKWWVTVGNEDISLAFIGPSNYHNIG